MVGPVDGNTTSVRIEPRLLSIITKGVESQVHHVKKKKQQQQTNKKQTKQVTVADLTQCLLAARRGEQRQSAGQGKVRLLCHINDKRQRANACLSLRLNTN